MSRRTINRLGEILQRTQQAREQSKRETPSASAVRVQMRRDEDALKEAISILSGEGQTNE